MSELLSRIMAHSRALAVRSLAEIGCATGSYERRMRSDHRPMILTYHGVLEAISDPMLDRFCITASTFRRQLERLARRVDFVDLNGLLAARPTRRPAVLLSFDDGFRSVHEVARPILRRLGIPAIVSTVAGLVDSGRTIWSLEIDLLMLRGDLPTIEIPTNGERRRFSLQNDAARVRASQFARATAWASGGDAPLQLVADLIGQFGDDRFVRLLRDHENLQIMGAAELRDLARDGFDVAAHGYYHLGLATLSEEQVQREVGEARTRLSALVPDARIDAFCLPYGSATDSVLTRIRDTGYRACLTTEGGRVTDPWLLSRFDAGKSAAVLLRDVARSADRAANPAVLHRVSAA
jgi:peptidoglycan/xylan/chitin deacetylase (PgdA/CDA1 family)